MIEIPPALQRRYGPLPLWGYGVIGAVGVGVFFYARKRAVAGDASGGNALDYVGPYAGGSAGGGGGASSGGGGAPSPSVAWLPAVGLPPTPDSWWNGSAWTTGLPGVTPSQSTDFLSRPGPNTRPGNDYYWNGYQWVKLANTGATNPVGWYVLSPNGSVTDSLGNVRAAVGSPPSVAALDSRVVASSKIVTFADDVSSVKSATIPPVPLTDAARRAESYDDYNARAAAAADQISASNMQSMADVIANARRLRAG